MWFKTNSFLFSHFFLLWGCSIILTHTPRQTRIPLREPKMWFVCGGLKCDPVKHVIWSQNYAISGSSSTQWHFTKMRILLIFIFWHWSWSFSIFIHAIHINLFMTTLEETMLYCILYINNEASTFFTFNK